MYTRKALFIRSSGEEVKAAVDGYFVELSDLYFKNVIRALETRLNEIYS